MENTELTVEKTKTEILKKINEEIVKADSGQTEALCRSYRTLCEALNIEKAEHGNHRANSAKAGS